MPLFSSEFILLCLIVIPVYYLVPGRLKVIVLLLAGYAYYWPVGRKYLLLLVALTLVDYILARVIHQVNHKQGKTLLLIASLGISLGGLIVFKYFLTLLAGMTDWSVFRSLIMPLGMSYYTFTRLAYIIDVYRGRIEPEKDLLIFATTLAFFPNIAAGPIEKVEHLAGQFRQPARFNPDRATEGLRLILWGTFQKLVIAETLAMTVTPVYSDPRSFSGPVLITATIFLAFQIYADFAGYTNIAIGIARLLGIDLFENFQQPYFASSVLQFWRRWHMSLTNWIRAYVFMPLSRSLLKKTGRRYGRVIETTAYLITMTLVGAWHGVGLTFIVWGLLHGVIMSVESFLQARYIKPSSRTKGRAILGALITFILVDLAWILFRANSLNDAWYILSHFFIQADTPVSLLAPLPGTLFGSLPEFIWSWLTILILLGANWLQVEKRLKLWLASPRQTILRWALYFIGLALIWYYGHFSAPAGDFIYFQF